MSMSKSLFLVIVSLLVLVIDQVWGHYLCTVGRCSIDQHCCGHSMCCNSRHYRLWDLWYFWLTFTIVFLLVLGCCLYYGKKRKLRRSNEVVIYSAHNDSVAHVPYGPTTQNTHYYMAPVMTSPSSPMIGQGYPQAYIHPTSPPISSYDGK